MSIEHSQILACFCTILSHSFYERSGPGPLGPVCKILVVRSGPEGPHFTRSVGTLPARPIQPFWEAATLKAIMEFQNNFF